MEEEEEEEEEVDTELARQIPTNDQSLLVGSCYDHRRRATQVDKSRIYSAKRVSRSTDDTAKVL